MRMGLQVPSSEIRRRGGSVGWRQWIRDVGMGGIGWREEAVREFVVGLLGEGRVRLGEKKAVALVGSWMERGRRRSGGMLFGFSGEGRMRATIVEMVRRIGKGRRDGVGMIAFPFSNSLCVYVR